MTTEKPPAWGLLIHLLCQQRESHRSSVQADPVVVSSSESITYFCRGS
jgi:hypothetical protein